MMQPSTTSGAVAKPNSSAPSSAPMTTSRPVLIWPSVCTRMRLRRRFSTSVCCVSARPSSHGVPTCLMDDSGDAPVPPSWPAITTWSALALATPAATVPTPTSDTSLTDTRGLGIHVLQIVDELGQVFDRVDVMVRRRRDQAHAREWSSAARRWDSDTLWPGNWPPSPGLAPCAILICIWSSTGIRRSRRNGPTPPGLIFDAAKSPFFSTCLMRGTQQRGQRVAVLDGARLRAFRRGSGSSRRLRRCWICRRCGSWPRPAPSALRPRSNRSDIAPVAKRLTISLAGSTSSSGMARDGSKRNSEQAAQGHARLVVLWSLAEPARIA